MVDASDIPRILSIRPSRFNRKDSVCWDHTTSGLYTVRSGYQVISELRNAQTTQAYTEPSWNELKNQVWKTKTSRKIKHFLWQALSGCVATTSRLADRHCGNDRRCPRCGAEEESINHLLFECPPAMQCWALSNIPSLPGLFPCNSLLNNFDSLLRRAKEGGAQQQDLFVFPWLIWFIWKARNEKVFNGREVSPVDTLHLAQHEAESWRLAQVLEESTENQNIDTLLGPQNTREPTTRPEKLRCQTDASWGKGAKTMGAGFVLLNGEDIIHVGMCAKPNNRSPLHAELQGLIWAMQEMLLQGREELHFETDCAQLISIIDKEEEWPSIDTELDEFREIRQYFSKFSISYIPRSGNIRADFLAKQSRHRGVPFSYSDRLVPQWLGSNLRLFASA